jgi:hypothetical protein
LIKLGFLPEILPEDLEKLPVSRSS